MNNDSRFFPARGRLVLLAIAALGLASATAAAQSRDEQDKPSAAPEASPPTSAPATPSSAPNKVEGVTVNAPRVRPGLGIPPEKRAALDAEAAQDQAWRDYRRSTPPLTDNPNDLSKDFPGLQTYLPK